MAEPFLSLIQSQRMSQVLAPQLRQSLELLQVPLLELRTLARQEMEQNPTLEEQAQEGEQIEIEPASTPPRRRPPSRTSLKSWPSWTTSSRTTSTRTSPAGPRRKRRPAASIFWIR